MAESHVTIATTNSRRYQNQLCKHWGHKLDVEEHETHAIVKLPRALLTMRADEAALQVHLLADDADGLEAMKHVVASHLDRFAFREAPFDYLWNDS